MKKWLFSLALLASFSQYCLAQEEEPVERGFDKDKLFVGGYFALSFGNITIVNISPQVGYRFNRYLAAGVGINGQYSQFKSEDVDGRTISREEYGVVGLNIFGRVYPIEQAFLQVQPEFNYVWGKQKFYGPPDAEFDLEGKFVPTVLLGAGAAIPAGKGAFIVMVQYDILQNERTPYGNKMFFSFGFNL